MDYIKRNNRLNELVGQMSKEIPEAMGAFTQLHKVAIKDSALSKKVKELIALGIGITVRCDGCIASHVNDALKSGAHPRRDHGNHRRCHINGWRPINGLWL